MVSSQFAQSTRSGFMVEIDCRNARGDKVMCRGEPLHPLGGGEEVVGAERCKVVMDRAEIGAREILAEQGPEVGVVAGALSSGDRH